MTAPLDPGPPSTVTATPDGRRWTLAFVRELAHPPESVWVALTEGDQLAQWAPFRGDRDLVEPGPFTVLVLDGEESVEQSGDVVRIEAPRLLEYDWAGDRLRWELEPTDVGTRLTLHHTVETPDWLPKVAAGWHLCLAVADRLLAGDPVGPIVGEAALDHGWQELAAAYARQLGIESD
jgi:uncharacterized protein YndB with AHSA1/START domain